jgi:hypothetical protein
MTNHMDYSPDLPTSPQTMTIKTGKGRKPTFTHRKHQRRFTRRCTIPAK